MTDKVQKIRKEVERLQKRAEHNRDTSLTENERQFWLGESNVLTLIGKYIDSLQEEPVSEEWIKELRTKLDSMSKEDFKKVFDKYAVDFNEEPVSEELEKIVEEITEPTVLNAYGTKELARRLRNTVIYGTSVSKDLEEEALVYSASDTITEDGKLVIDSEKVNAFKAGAKWQFERVNEALLSEVLPCFMHGGEADEVVAKLDEVLNKKK